MHVFVTGASGFVGTYVLQELLKQGHSVRCLVHNDRKKRAFLNEKTEWVKGDATRPSSLIGLMQGCDAVIHLVGIIEEVPAKKITFERLHVVATQNIVNEARKEGIAHFIHMSANGANENGVSAYQTTKWKAEQYVKNAGFEHWTVFRPSMIFGKPIGETIDFATQITETLIKPFPILPVFGDGEYRMQPVAVEEVSVAMVAALEETKAQGQVYEAGGREAFSYKKVLDIITIAVRSSTRLKMPQPLWLMRPLIHFLEPWGILPVTEDQFEMLVEGNTCDPRSFYNDFELPFKPFTSANLAYLKDKQAEDSG